MAQETDPDKFICYPFKQTGKAHEHETLRFIDPDKPIDQHKDRIPAQVEKIISIIEWHATCVEPGYFDYHEKEIKEKLREELTNLLTTTT